MKRCLQILISGRVQGVFFRYSARQRAEELDLAGYAKNLLDGRVEIVAEGDERRLRILLAWARQGPPGAYVEGVEVNWLPIKNSFPSFTIR
jgi:acylphosphatase